MPNYRRVTLYCKKRGGRDLAGWQEGLKLHRFVLFKDNFVVREMQ